MVVAFGHLISMCIYIYILKGTKKELSPRQEEVSISREKILYLLL